MAMSLDRFVHTNPAFSLTCLHWVCTGYAQQKASQSKDDIGFLFIWGVVSLIIIAPESTRKNLPKNSSAKLAIILHQNPSWRQSILQSAEDWITPFWIGVKLGIETGTLTIINGRLISIGRVGRPKTAEDVKLRTQAITLGKLFAKEEDDNAIALALGLTVTL